MVKEMTTSLINAPLETIDGVDMPGTPKALKEVLLPSQLADAVYQNAFEKPGTLGAGPRTAPFAVVSFTVLDVLHKLASFRVMLLEPRVSAVVLSAMAPRSTVDAEAVAPLTKVTPSEAITVGTPKEQILATLPLRAILWVSLTTIAE